MNQCCIPTTANSKLIDGSIDLLNAVCEPNRLKVLCVLSQNESPLRGAPVGIKPQTRPWTRNSVSDPAASGEVFDTNKICVCDLAKELNLANNLLSFHLKVLFEAGILDKKREGNQIFYFIQEEWRPRVEHFFKFIGTK